MAGKTLDVNQLIIKDHLGCFIANQWMEWEGRRATWKEQKKEVRKFVYQTDTSQTTVGSLGWNNTTTLPKLCHIRDNLAANYIATMFPTRRWVNWEGDDQASETKVKKEAIKNYMCYCIEQPHFKDEVVKMVFDYIDYGNVIVTADWRDDTVEQETGDKKTQTGYIGPVPRRISPMDIVFNPLAPSFIESPKIVKSMMTLGELKKILVSQSKPEEIEELNELFNYLRDIRLHAGELSDSQEKDEFLQMDGFDSYRAYLTSPYVECLTFYGDIYDIESDTFLPNHVIMVVDRHKIVYKKPNPSFFGYPPFFHAGWRPRQDSLWAMGPLDNLLGLQHRLDHIENNKSDVLDLAINPIFKVKGYVEDFEWVPRAKIITSEEGDVELMHPDVSILQVNSEINEIERRMEEYAGAPKEAMGIRTPGEKTMYEVQRLESAASRIFQNKIAQFEEQILEPLLNAMLELARRRVTSQTIRGMDDEFQVATFITLSAEDITGNGRIKPVAARHFAERAQLIQNLNSFYQSPINQDPQFKSHWSSIKEAKMWEEVLDLQDWKLVEENIRVTEAADTQRMANAQQEQVAMEAGTSAGLQEDDIDLDTQI